MKTASPTRDSLSTVGNLQLVSSLVLALALSALGADADSKATATQDDTERIVDYRTVIAALQKEWKAGNLDRLDILHISTNAIYRTSISSSLLEQIVDFKLSIRDATADLVKESIEILAKLNTEPSGTNADVRWGLIFYGKNDRRLLSVYVESEGRKGVVDGACVYFDTDALPKWARKTFAGVLK